MSTQSGITAAPELIEAFAQAQQDPTTRALLVTIENEQLVPGTTFSKSGSAAEDFEKLSTILTEDKPCYVAYRLDADADWVLVAWVPTSAPVKAKMLVGPL